MEVERTGSSSWRLLPGLSRAAPHRRPIGASQAANVSPLCRMSYFGHGCGRMKPCKSVFARRRGDVRRPKGGRRLKPVQIKRFTGFEPPSWRGLVRPLRSGRYRVDDRRPGGDAPKDFLWVYECVPGGVRRSNPAAWPAFIAKVGHQFYPAESATEQIMTRVGQLCGLDIADSRLMLCANQLRFLSRYFLGADEILNHGAEILIGYVADKQFVDGVAHDKAEKTLFTFQVFCTAIKTRFPEHHEDLLAGFVRMIGFDALVGNQDRHFYNWGVITHLTGAVPPRFAPIYDTARGLFWNTPESGLAKYANPDSLQAYVRRSTPQIGWDGWNKDKAGDLSHFELVTSVAADDASYWRLLKKLSERALQSLGECEGMIDAEFTDILTPRRRDLIKRCLRLRFETFATIL